MNTAIIYGKNDSITEKSFAKRLDIVSQLFSQGDSLSLICFSDEKDFKKFFNKITKSNDIVLFTPSVFNKNKSFFERKLETELFGFSKRSFFSCLPDGDCEFFGVVAKILCSLFGEDYCFAYDYLDITGQSLDSIKETITTECLFSNPHLFVLNNHNSVRILIVSESSTQQEADKLCTETLKNLEMLFGDNAFSNHFHSIAVTVVELLSKHGLKVATAESCTAGMLSSAITSVPGSSDVFEIGISSYADRIKKAALGVSESTLHRYGAVSMQTAIEMAHGIKTLSDSDLGISATGVAGPGASEMKSVGTVYIALTDGKYNWVVDLNLDSALSREEIRKKTTFACLDLLRRYLVFYPEPMPYGTEISKTPMLLHEQPHISNKFCNFKVAIGEDTENYTQESFLQVNNEEMLYNNENNEMPNVNCFSKFKNIFLQIFTYFQTLPFNKQKIKKITANAIFTLVISLFIISNILAYSFIALSTNNKNLTNELAANWSFSEEKDINNEFVAFKALNKINSDIYGWLKVGDNRINLPVCNSYGEYYKIHNYKNNLSPYGAIYSNTPVDSLSKNIVLYGNSPIDGSMFASLNEYKSFNFLKANEKITFTFRSVIKSYQVFAVMIVDQNEQQDFSFIGTDFSNAEQTKEWVDNIRIRSLYNFNASIPNSSTFITLVTDTDEFDGAKIVIVGFSVDDETNYISLFSVNSAPYYPDAWYEKHGLKNPHDKTVILPGEIPEVSAPTETTPTVSNPDTQPEDGEDSPTNAPVVPPTASTPTTSTPTTSTPTTSTPATSTPTVDNNASGSVSSGDSVSSDITSGDGSEDDKTDDNTSSDTTDAGDTSNNTESNE